MDLQIKENNRIRSQRHRENLTDEQKALERERQRIRSKMRRDNMSEAQRALERERQRIRDRNRRERMDEEQKLLLRERQRVRERQRRENMDEEKRVLVNESRRVRERERRKKLVGSEVVERREVRRVRDSERRKNETERRKIETERQRNRRARAREKISEEQFGMDVSAEMRKSGVECDASDRKNVVDINLEVSPMEEDEIVEGQVAVSKTSGDRNSVEGGGERGTECLDGDRGRMSMGIDDVVRGEESELSLHQPELGSSAEIPNDTLGLGTLGMSSGEGLPAMGGEKSPAAPLSRYEAQKRRDWNTFSKYIKNHKPPILLSRCNDMDVIDFLKHLDQFGKSKVHVSGCAYFGHSNLPEPCDCPLKQAWGSQDSMIGRLRAAYEENGGQPELNPFGASTVRVYLREVRDSQAKARGMPYRKKRKRVAMPTTEVANAVMQTAAVESGGGGGGGGGGELSSEVTSSMEPTMAHQQQLAVQVSTSRKQHEPQGRPNPKNKNLIEGGQGTLLVHQSPSTVQARTNPENKNLIEGGQPAFLVHESLAREQYECHGQTNPENKNLIEGAKTVLSLVSASITIKGATWTSRKNNSRK